jgi:hypothetical protein
MLINTMNAIKDLVMLLVRLGMHVEYAGWLEVYDFTERMNKVYVVKSTPE